MSSIILNGKEYNDGISDIVEITQSAYNALPNTKYTDGVLYCISDSVDGVDAYPPLIYSDEEREIGVWRDGKPLYQKTIYIPSLPTSAGYSDTPLNMSDITVVHSFGDVIWTNGTSRPFTLVMDASSPTTYNGTGQISYSIENNSIIRIVVGTNRGSLSAYITIQYTKTTDTAGSGRWTTQGTLAHHYSTNETVVGTWVNNKPLYEQTIHMSANFSSTKTYSIPTAEDLFLIDGFFVCASGSTQYQVPLNYTESGYSSYSGWNKTSHNVYFRLAGFSSTDVYATVRYTKTT